MKRLADFEPLLPAEKRLVAWLQAGNRKTLQLSQSAPDAPSEAVNLRATFIRYLALGGCEDCRLPETGLQVRGAYIEGDDDNSEFTKGLDFEGAKLSNDLGLYECYTVDLINLRSAKIKNLFLNGTVVKAGITADRMHAEGGVSLDTVVVSGEVRLLGARLWGDLDCNFAEFQEQTDALSCDGMQTEGGIILDGAKCAGTVQLSGTLLRRGLSCNGIELWAKDKALVCDGMRTEGGVFLNRAKIAGEVQLTGTHLGRNLECDGAELQGNEISLNCTAAKISGAFLLRKGAKVSGCIDLSDAELGSICDSSDSWPPEIILVRCRYGAFQGNNAPTDAKKRLLWLALQQPKKYDHDFWPEPYENCAKVLREMGHGADARVILIEKERLQRLARRERIARDLAQARHDRDTTPEKDGLRLHTDRVIGHWLHLTGQRIWDGIAGFFVGYGRKPLDAFWRGLVPLWLIGILVFGNAAGHGAIKPNLPQIQLNRAWVGCADDKRGQLDCFLNHSDAASYPRFNAFIYSADTLIPVVSLEMQSYWIPDDSSNRGMLARGYLWFHIAMGWALTLLAVAGFSGLIKTDNTK